MVLLNKAKIEREDSLTIASLKDYVASLTASLEEESYYRTIASLKASVESLTASLEERLESLDDKNDEITAKFIKEKDHVLAKYKVIKKEKTGFVAANARLVEEKEKLEKAFKIGRAHV